MPCEEPTSCMSDWSQADDYSVFEHEIQGTSIWLSLVIEAKPQS
jgi:hypothetical protein